MKILISPFNCPDSSQILLEQSNTSWNTAPAVCESSFAISSSLTNTGLPCARQTWEILAPSQLLTSPYSMLRWNCRSKLEHCPWLLLSKPESIALTSVNRENKSSSLFVDTLSSTKGGKNKNDEIVLLESLEDQLICWYDKRKKYYIPVPSSGLISSEWK